MATTGEILTGSTDAPVSDGSMRGLITGGVESAIAVFFIALTMPVEIVAASVGAQTMLAFMAWGMWDRWMRGKVTARSANPAK